MLSFLFVIAAGIVALVPVLANLASGANLPWLHETAVWLYADSRVLIISGTLILAAVILHWSSGHLVRANIESLSNSDCPNSVQPGFELVHSGRGEQFIGRLTGLPIARYHCLTCGVEGLYLARNITNDKAIASSAPAQLTGSSGVRSLDALFDQATRPFHVAIFYLLVLTLAEVIAVLVSPLVGVILHMVILFVLIVHAAFTWSLPIHRFLLALTLVPTIRIISLSLPLVQFPLTYWFFITSVPLFGAAYVTKRELNFTWRQVFGARWRGLPLQLLIGLTGVFLGYVEYLILQPEPLIESFSWQNILLPSLILLISTGFLEEFIFRFLLQRTSIERLGVAWGIVYVAIFFAVLHIGHHSVPNFFFVLVVGLIFGWLAYKTGSILGVTIAHGMTNIFLFLVVPFLSLGSSLSFESELYQLCTLSGLAPATCETIGLEEQMDASRNYDLGTAAGFGEEIPNMIKDLNQDLQDWWIDQVQPALGEGAEFQVIDYGEAMP